MKAKFAWFMYFLGPMALVIVMGYFLAPRFFEIKIINAESMLPTLQPGDRVIFIRHSENVQRYDILLVIDPWRLERVYVKRCIGLPQEQFEIRAKAVFINGQPLINDPGVFKDPHLHVGRDVPLRFSKDFRDAYHITIFY